MNPNSIIDKIVGFFDGTNLLIRSVESSIVNLLAAVGPWLAPLAPAFMSYIHMRNTMLFPEWVSISIALVIEILGLSAVSTMISFWMHNRKGGAKMKRAPLGITIFAFTFYLAVVLTLNVALDAATEIGDPATSTMTMIMSRGLLTLLSIPAALILAVRTGHRELLMQIERDKEERRSKLQLRSKQVSSYSDNGRKDYRHLSHKEKMQVFELSTKEVMQAFGVSERTAQNWRRNAERDITQ